MDFIRVERQGEVASVTIDHDITCDDLLRALNARIKDGAIRVRAVEEMFDGGACADGALDVGLDLGERRRRVGGVQTIVDLEEHLVAAKPQAGGERGFFLELGAGLPRCVDGLLDAIGE